MSHFSKIVLHKDAMSLQEFAELGFGPQAHHEIAWKAFGDHPDRRRDFLFRADLERDALVLWAVSERPPGDWGGRLDIRTKEYTPTLTEGQRVRFDVRVNPTVSSREAKGRGRRHDAVMHFKRGLTRERREEMSQAEIECEAMSQWLTRRGEGSGFALTDPPLVERYVQHEFRKSKGPNIVRLSTIDVSATVTVTNPDAFRTLLLEGLGAAKAYGNGLILVRPS